MGRGTDPVSAIEAALQAGLGGGTTRPDLARRALLEADCPHLAAWLAAVALELDGGPVLVPVDMVDAIAARMRADRLRSLRAHRRLERRAIGDLIRG